MAKVTPYSDESSKKAQVEKMFDRISGRYDFLNRILSLGIDRKWRKKVIRILNELQAEFILDVATGTGDLAFETLKKVPSARLIVGLDISEGMLNIARQKAKVINSPIVQFTQGDAEKMPFESNSFDAVTVAFGVRNFEDLDKGLAEINRVLKPGGTLIVLEFSQVKGPFKPFFQFYFKYILPLIGKWVSQDAHAYRYLFNSVQVFPEGASFLTHLKNTGFSESTWIPLTAHICSIYRAVK